MERLTKKLNTLKECVSQMGDKEEIKVNKTFLKDVCEYFEQLKSYKDAEGQGLLLRLPCKVGDTVYHIINNTDSCLECPHYSDFYGTDSMCSKNKGNTVFEPRWQDEPVCNEHFYEISESKAELEYIVRNLNNFGKTVFLTKEEAEQALKQMGE